MTYLTKKNSAKQGFISMLLLFFCASCTSNYDIDRSQITVQKCLALNGILSPSQPLRIQFYTIDRQGDYYVCQAATGVSVKLTENGVVIYEGVCPDTALLLNRFPQVNARYRIEAQKDNYDATWAETTVPEAVTCRAHTREVYSYNRGQVTIAYLYDFSGFGSVQQSALYISSYKKEVLNEWDTITHQAVVTINDSVYVEVSDLYSRNFYIDNINRMGGMPFVHEDVGSLYFENFMRIRAENIVHLDTLAFSEAGLKIRLIVAGTDYDRYIRTAYEQSNYHSSVEGGTEEISAIFYQPIPIYSNINGGMGIFAGINEFLIENKEDETH